MRMINKHYYAFDAMMNYTSRNLLLDDSVKRYTGENIRKIADIGGGSGAVLIQIFKIISPSGGEYFRLGFCRKASKSKYLKKTICLKEQSLLEEIFFKTL